MPDPKLDQEPKAEPTPKVEPSAEPVKEPVKEPKEPVKADPLSTVLDGDGIPEKYRGKTVKEFVESVKTTETELTTAKTSLGQWEKYFQDVLDGKIQVPARDAEPAENPLSKIDEDTANAIMYAIGMQNRPLMDGIGAILKEYVRSGRPDFDAFEEQATKYYNKFQPEAKIDPKLSWDLAYRLAKADAIGAPKPEPTTVAPSLGDKPVGEPDMSDEEKVWCKKLGMTQEEYLKYKHFTPKEGA